AVGVERPAAFPSVDRAGQLSRVDDRVLDLFDNGLGTPVCERDPGFGEPGRGSLESVPSVGRGVLPSGSLQYCEGTRALRRRRLGRTLQSGIPRIAAGPSRNVHRDEPRVLERGGEHTGAALAEIIVAAAAVDDADARLEADAAAEARRAQDRADDLRP